MMIIKSVYFLNFEKIDKNFFLNFFGVKKKIVIIVEPTCLCLNFFSFLLDVSSSVFL